jgi:hypothetical protein
MTAEPVLPCVHHFSPRTDGQLNPPMLIIFSSAFYICVCRVPMAIG